jgi:hypothetical protein
MSGLVPDGVYSLFCRIQTPDSNNSVCPDVEPSIALTSTFPQLQKPDAECFVASDSGPGTFPASRRGFRVGGGDGHVDARHQLKLADQGRLAPSASSGVGRPNRCPCRHRAAVSYLSTAAVLAAAERHACRLSARPGVHDPRQMPDVPPHPELDNAVRDPRERGALCWGIRGGRFRRIL